MSAKHGLQSWRRLASHVAPALRRERGTIAMAALAIAAETGLRMLEPWPLTLVVDRLTGKTAGLHVPGLSDARMPQLALLAALALLMIVVARALAGYVQTIRLALAASRILTDLRSALYRRLQMLPLSWHSRARTGDLTVRLTTDVGYLQDVALTAALPLVGDVCVQIAMLSLMVWLDPWLTAIALAPVPLFLIRWKRSHTAIREVARQQRRREGAMAATAAESLAAIRTVQALSLTDAVDKTFSKANNRSNEQGVRAKRLSAGMERSVDVLLAISMGLVLWTGALRVDAGLLTAGQLLVFLAYLKTAFKPLQSFAKYTARLGKSTAAAERVLDVLDQSPETGDAPGAVPAPRLRGEVTFEDVSFAYTAERTVLQHFSCRIAPGELVAIVGPSGVGKSTLTSLLLRLYTPTAGRVFVDGRNVRDLTVASYRAQIGVVLQETVLFAGTVRENLLLGAPSPISTAQLEQALRWARALDFVGALPRGLDTPVGERGVTLSSGQRQRLAIARTILRDTPVLVLDEPTVGLDEENEAAVTEAILRLAQGRTTLLVTHALHLAARADRVLVMGDGGVRESGAPADLLRTGGAFASWYRDQAARMGGAPVPLPVAHAHAG